MTDHDTTKAWHRNTADPGTTPESIGRAVIRYMEDEAAPLPPTPVDLALPPTDAEIFGGVPTALPEEITEKVVRLSGGDAWDVPTVVPTGDE